MRPLSSFWSALERPVSWLQSSCFVSGSSIFVTRRTKRCIYAVSDATLLLPLLIHLLLPLLPPHRRRIRKPERLCRLLGSGCSYTCLVWLGSLIVGFPRRVFRDWHPVTMPYWRFRRFFSFCLPWCTRRVWSAILVSYIIHSSSWMYFTERDVAGYPVVNSQPISIFCLSRCHEVH